MKEQLVVKQLLVKCCNQFYSLSVTLDFLCTASTYWMLEKVFYTLFTISTACNLCYYFKIKYCNIFKITFSCFAYSGCRQILFPHIGGRLHLTALISSLPKVWFCSSSLQMQLPFLLNSQTLVLLHIIFFILPSWQLFLWQQAVAVEEGFDIRCKEFFTEVLCAGQEVPQ